MHCRDAQAQGAEVVVCKPTRNGNVDLDDVFRRLTAYGRSVMVEGGSQIISSVLHMMMTHSVTARERCGVRSCIVLWGGLSQLNRVLLLQYVLPITHVLLRIDSDCFTCVYACVDGCASVCVYICAYV